MDYISEDMDGNLLESKIIHIDFTEFLTPAHKLIFLKYMQLNMNFIEEPESYPKLAEMASLELNKVSGQLSSDDWMSLMRSWYTSIREKCSELKNSNNNKKNFSFSFEDYDLLTLIDGDSFVQEPSNSELSCILDHLEIACTSAKVWVTIALELEALGAPLHKGEYWKKAFERWVNKVKRKKQILDEMQISEKEKYTFLNSLEQRLLEFYNSGEYTKKEDEVCRVCLNTNNESLIDIYDYNTEDKTLVEKMCECANIQIAKNDGFPQHICQSCLALLEDAYKFKSLAEESDYQLRNVNKSVSSEEYVEYIIDMDDGDEDMSQKHAFEDHIELLDITFNEENKKVENRAESETYEEELIPSEATSIIDDEAKPTIHQCDICGIICYNKTSLKKHMHSHSIERPYQCKTCKKEFKTKLTLSVHIRSHTGERPYICETCGKGFKTWSAVSNHRAIHSKVKMFKCQLCPYRGSTKANLQIHSRTHTGVQPYACDQCELKFSTASNRIKHIKNIHEKMKLHECGSCGRSFFSRESARKHMVIHTGLKPFTCPVCPMTYGWYNGLQKHMKTQHPGVKMPTEKHFMDTIDSYN